MNPQGYRYRAFGLSIRSDVEFPELFPLPEGTGAEVEIAESPERGDDGIAGPALLNLSLPVGHFRIEKGSRILYRRDPGVSDDALRLFILGSGFGALLQQRGCVVLHGNAVSTDGIACRIIVGHSGAGKSTAAAWHYRQGHKILADDVCAVIFDAEGRPLVIPSYPQIKLWKASADLLGIDTAALRRVREEADKFAIMLGAQFQAVPLPLTEVIELHADHTAAAPIQGMQKARCLIEHSYRHNYVKEMGLSSAYMKSAMRLAGLVAVRTGVREVIAPQHGA